MEKAYKFRIYPNKKQKEILAKTFGCCRFVYNHYLAKKIALYKTSNTTLTYNQCCSDLTQLKNELIWLKEADKFALQNSLKDLDNAYQKFLRNTAVSRNSNPRKHTSILIERVLQIIILSFAISILNYQNSKW